MVLVFHKLGDSVFTIPALRLLKQVYDKPITILCFEGTESIFQIGLQGYVIIPINKKYFIFWERFATTGVRRTLARLKPSTIIDLTGVMTTASLIFSSRAEYIYGFNRQHFKGIYDKFMEFELDSHSMDIYLNTVKKIFNVDEGTGIRIFPYTRKSKIKVGIHPFAGWAAKEWNLYKFIELSIYLRKEIEVEIIIHKENLLSKYEDVLSANSIKIIYTPTTESLINEIKSLSLLISNDTGPIQIASLLGVSTFSIYGPTNPTFHLPYGSNHYYVQHLIQCSPKKEERQCFTFGGRYGCPSFKCMDQLSAEKVFQKVNEVLKKIV
ncbi:MAG: glycosyltransferase family 9 protein [Ignavibacteriales bacterium]|nr:glycosyltransferase family 9 protein [Ignavibacteriales bacterium]